MSKPFVRFLVLFMACLAVSLFFSGQLRLLSQINGMKASWWNIMSWEFTRWFLWMIFIPFIFRLIRRYSYHPGSRKRFFMIHSGASIGISLLHLGLFSILYWFILQMSQAVQQGRPMMEAIHEANFDPDRIFRMIFILDFHMGIILYWSLLAGHSTITYSRRASELKSELVSAQLEALKMQLQPHFLFNTLNSISALLHKNVEAADEMIGELGNFLRLTLQGKSDHEVSLQQELIFLQSYLEIEKIRFESRLSVIMNIDPRTTEARVPHLILQPIIENAIRYGIAPRLDSGQIEVLSEMRNDHLYLKVQDDGPGLSESHREGIGLRNVRERLLHLYGNDHQFRLANRREGGLMVEMEIPFHTNPVQEVEQHV